MVQFSLNATVTGIFVVNHSQETDYKMNKYTQPFNQCWNSSSLLLQFYSHSRKLSESDNPPSGNKCVFWPQPFFFLLNMLGVDFVKTRRRMIDEERERGRRLGKNKCKMRRWWRQRRLNEWKITHIIACIICVWYYFAVLLTLFLTFPALGFYCLGN